MGGGVDGFLPVSDVGGPLTRQRARESVQPSPRVPPEPRYSASAVCCWLRRRPVALRRVPLWADEQRPTRGQQRRAPLWLARRPNDFG